MIMKVFLFSILLLLSFVSLAQNPSILWQKTIGGNIDDDLERYIDPSSDGYYFIGNSSSNVSGDKTDSSRGFDDIWIVKTDVNYNILWDKTIGGELIDRTIDVLIVENVIYILAQSNSNISGEKTINSFGSSDLWLVACDLNGMILWQEQYGGSNLESFGKLLELANGNVLITSLSSSNISGNKTENVIGGSDIWVVEINPNNGAIIQQKTIGTINNESIANSFQTPQGTILIKGGAIVGISGDKTEIGYGEEDIWIVELDQNFNVLRDKCFGGDLVEEGSFGNLILDGDNYYIIGSSGSGVSGNKTTINHGPVGWGYLDYWLIKTDLDFNIIWDKSYGGGGDDQPSKIFKNEWNKIVVSGNSYSGISGNKTSPLFGGVDFWLLIVNENGDIVAQETYGGSDFDLGIVQKQEISNTNLFLSAFSTSGISGNKTLPSKGNGDCWFMELDASSFLNTNEIPGSETKISVYPNPFQDAVNFKFTELKEETIIRFFSMDGKLLEEKVIKSGTEVFVWEAETTSEFIFYEVIGANINYRGKLVRF